MSETKKAFHVHGMDPAVIAELKVVAARKRMTMAALITWLLNTNDDLIQEDRDAVMARAAAVKGSGPKAVKARVAEYKNYPV